MTLQKLRRWLGFPLEDRYRVHIEQDIVQSSLRPLSADKDIGGCT